MKKESNKNKIITVRVSEEIFLKLKRKRINIAKVTREALENVLKAMPIVLLMLTSCGAKDLGLKHFANDELESLYNEFKVEAELRDVEIDDTALSVYFSDSNTLGEIARCTRDEHITLTKDGYKKYTIKNIMIKKHRWDNLNPIGKKTTMFHELSHCTLGQGHRHGKATVTNVTSIMQENSTPLKNIDQESMMMNNWNTLLDELFYY